MKKIILLLILFIIACVGIIQNSPQIVNSASSLDTQPVLHSPPTTENNPFDKWSLWTNGTQLRGANTWQRIVVPKYDGPNFLGDGYIGPPYTQNDFDALAALGANYVNLSHPGIFTERPPYVLDEQVLANLDKMVTMATKADLFVVITFRTGPGRNDFTFYREDDWFEDNDLIEILWGNPDAQEAWAEMWQYTASIYRDNPVVIGYDLICEPNANDILNEWEIEEFYANYGDTIYDWNTWYPNLVAAIRAVDTQTPILVGGDGYSSLEWLPSLKPIDAQKIIYSFHQYSPHAYTHQETNEKRTYPGKFDLDYDEKADIFNHAWLKKQLSIASDYANEHNVVIAVNEYGATRWAPNAANFMRDEMTIFEKMGLNYALWVWDPIWQPWNQGVNFLNFRYGSNPKNTTAVENELQNIIIKFWEKNTLRPSDFMQEDNTAVPEN